MPVIVEAIPNPVDVRHGVFTSAGMVAMLKTLPEGHCVTLLTNTGQDLERQRTHWSNAAKRAGVYVVSRSVTTETGERAIRIWRTDYP